MKATALVTRIKEKDTWDIYYCILYYLGGIKKLAELFCPLFINKLAQEVLENIAEKFSTPEHVRLKYMADFEEITKWKRDWLKRDAYIRVNALRALLR